MRSIVTAILVLVLPVVSYAEPSLTGTISELTSYLSAPQTVVVTGRAEIKVQADRAVVQVKVTTEDRSLQQALRKNQGIRSQMTAALTKAGIPAERIKGSRFSSTPNQSRWTEKIKSYTVDNLIHVSIASEEEFQKVAAEVDLRDEASCIGVVFERSDETELKRKAISEACDAAVAKKQLFQEKLNLTLTTARFMEAFSGPMPQYVVDESGRDYAMRRGVANYMMASVPTEAGGALSQFDEIVYLAEVTLECKVAP